MLQLNFSPFPVLETERLRLRKITEQDIESMFAIRSDADSMRYVPRPLAKTREDVTAHIKMINDGIEKNEFINWGITLKNKDEMIGILGFYRIAKEDNRAEVGYMLNKNFYRKGIMQEAIQAALIYGFEEMKLHKTDAVIDPRNTASENVLLKAGFTKEAHFKEHCFFEGEYRDDVHYALLRSEWNRQ